LFSFSRFPGNASTDFRRLFSNSEHTLPRVFRSKRGLNVPVRPYGWVWKRYRRPRPASRPPCSTCPAPAGALLRTRRKRPSGACCRPACRSDSDSTSRTLQTNANCVNRRSWTWLGDMKEALDRIRKNKREKKAMAGKNRILGKNKYQIGLVVSSDLRLCSNSTCPDLKRFNEAKQPPGLYYIYLRFK